MQPVLVLVILAVAAVFFGHNGALLPSVMQANVSDTQQVSQQMNQQQVAQITQKSNSQSKSAAVIKSVEVSPITNVPLILVDTYIASGPRNGEVFDTTNEVTFNFGAVIPEGENRVNIFYETKVDGFDNAWVKTSSKQRTIKLPAGTKEYTFLVRAGIKTFVDKTPAKRTFKINVSPYFDKVKVSQVQTSAYPNPSLITLNTYITTDEKINITGWKLKGENGSFEIYKGVEKYYPLIYPYGENILVKKGDTIQISSAQNPLGERDKNFRINKCMGYLTNSYTFPISISKSCPKVSQADLPGYLSTCCKEFIGRLSSCGSAKYQDLQSYKLFSDSSCMTYINDNFNYGGCFKNYSKAENFSGNQWHIYTNMIGKEIVDKDKGTVYLYDQNGLVVNKYSFGCKDSCKQ